MKKRGRYFDSNVESPAHDGDNCSVQRKRIKSESVTPVTGANACYLNSSQNNNCSLGRENIKSERLSPSKGYQNSSQTSQNKDSTGAENSMKKFKELESYYGKILQTLKTIPKEDTEMFVSNVLQESQDYEVQLSCSRFSSHCIELLLSICTDSDVWIQYMTAFSAKKIEVCTNANASHVTELLINIAIQNMKNWESVMESEENNVEKKNVTFFISWLTEFSDFVVHNFESCLQDQYASHVACNVIQALGGDMSKEFSTMSKKTENHRNDFHQQYIVESTSGINQHIDSVVLDNIPKFFTKMLKKLAKSLVKIDAIADYVTESSSAVVIEILLSILKKRIPKRCKKLILRLATKIFSERNDAGVPMAFLHRNISFVVENMFQAADEEIQLSLWNDYCVDCLEPLIRHSVGNYIIQRLFDEVESQTLFEAMSEKIGSLFDIVLNSRHYGIFLSMAKACNRLKVQQAQFTKNLMQCLQCAEPEDRQKRFIPLLLGFNVYNPRNDSIYLQGSLLAQVILQFQKPIKAVNSLLSMKPQELSNLACHIQGCHVLNAFFSSVNVGEKNKDKLIQCMKPCLTSLACDRSGSMTLSRIWVLLNIKQRSIIAQQFVKDETFLKADKNGNILLKKFGIFHFRRDNTYWKELQSNLSQNKQNSKCKCK